MSFDFKAGARVTGSKFLFTTGDEARMEWMIINKMIDYHVENGYLFVIPPYLVNTKTAVMAGILPRFDGQFYETSDEAFILIPTAEVPMVGLHAGEIFDENELPKRYVAFSPCFRREAGSHGKRDRGLRRVHQFHKVELFTICTAEQAEREYKSMRIEVEQMLSNLWPYLPYRVVELDKDERSPVAVQTFDIEVMHGNEWLEVSSISTTGTNQSTPAQIRYRSKKTGKNEKCHLLNGSGVALPRLMLALGIGGEG